MDTVCEEGMPCLWRYCLLLVINIEVKDFLHVAFPTTRNLGLYMNDSGGPPRFVLLQTKLRHISSKLPIYAS